MRYDPILLYAIIKTTNETGGCFIMTWKVWFISILGDEVYTWVKADSFDEAMDIARSLDMRYCCAQVVKE